MMHTRHFRDVPVNGHFLHRACPGEWFKVNTRIAWNMRGQAVEFSPADVVRAD